MITRGQVSEQNPEALLIDGVGYDECIVGMIDGKAVYSLECLLEATRKNNWKDAPSEFAEDSEEWEDDRNEIEEETDAWVNDILRALGSFGKSIRPIVVFDSEPDEVLTDGVFDLDKFNELPNSDTDN